MKTLNTTTAKFFGKTVDLTKLDKYPKPKKKGGKFVGYTFLDLTSQTTQDFLAVQDDNTGIRAGGINWSDVTKVITSHEVQDFQYHEFADRPIVWDITKNEIDEGRTRTKGALKNFEKVLPVAMFEFPNKTQKTKVVNGITGNGRRVYGAPTTREDIIVATVDLVVTHKEIPCTKAAIRDFITDPVDGLDAYNLLPQKDVTIAIDVAFERAESGLLELMLKKERGEWKKWLVATGHNPDEYVLCQVDRKWNVADIWMDDILPKYRMFANKPKLVLFTKESLPRIAKERMTKFKEDLEQIYQDTYKLVNHEMGKRTGDAVSVHADVNLDNRPYEIVGCMPQIIGEHDHEYKTGQIISLSEYVKGSKEDED